MAFREFVTGLVDEERGRVPETMVWLPKAGGRTPLVVFGHGFCGHRRGFTKLLSAWVEAGVAVAAPVPAHKRHRRQAGLQRRRQPAGDVRFVLDELLARPEVDPARIGMAGFSLGAVTAVAVGFHERERDPRVRAVVSLAGAFSLALGGPGFYEMTKTPLLVAHDTRVVGWSRIGERGGVLRRARAEDAGGIEGGLHARLFQDPHGPHPLVVERTLDFWRRFLARPTQGGGDDEVVHVRWPRTRPAARRRSR